MEMGNDAFVVFEHRASDSAARSCYEGFRNRYIRTSKKHLNRSGTLKCPLQIWLCGIAVMTVQLSNDSSTSAVTLVRRHELCFHVSIDE